MNGIVELSRDTIDWAYCEKLAGLLDEVVEVDLVNALARLRLESENK